MADLRPDRRARDHARAFRERHARRARALASVLAGCDDDEITVRPWQSRLPATVILAIAREHGFVPLGGHHATFSRDAWVQPVHLLRLKDNS